MRSPRSARCLALAITALIATSPALAKEKRPVDPNKKICRSEIPTGSRMTKSICHTMSEWAAVDAANAQGAQALSDRAVRSGSVNE